MSNSDNNNWLGSNMFIPLNTGNRENITTSLSKLDNYVVFDNNETSERESRGRGRGRSRSISETDFTSQLNIPKNNKQTKVNSSLLSSFLLGASQGKRSTSLSASREGNTLNSRRLSETFGGNTASSNVSAIGLLNFNKNKAAHPNIVASSKTQPKLSDLLSNALSMNKNYMGKEKKENLKKPKQINRPLVESSTSSPAIKQDADTPILSSMEYSYSNNRTAGNNSQISSTASTKVDLVQPVNTPRLISNKFEIDYVGGSLNDNENYDNLGTPNPENAVPTEFEQLCENSALISQASSNSQRSSQASSEEVSQLKSTINQLPPQSLIYNKRHKQQASSSSQDLNNDLMILETQQRHHQRQRSLRLVQSVNDLQPSTNHGYSDHHHESTSSLNGMGIIGYTYADIVDKRMSHISNLSGLSWEEVPIAVRDAHKRLTSNEESVVAESSGAKSHNSGRELRKAKSSRELVEKEEKYIDAEMQLNLLKQQQIDLKMKQMELQIQELKLTNDKLRYAMTDQRQIQDKMIYETLHDTLRTKENIEIEMNRKVDLLENKVQDYKNLISKLTEQQEEMESAIPATNELGVYYETGNESADESTTSPSPTPKSNTPVTRSNSLYVKKNRLSKIDPYQLEEMTKSRNTSRIEYSSHAASSSVSNSSKMKRMSTVSSTGSSTNSGYNKKKGVNLNIPIRIDSSNSF